MIATVSPSSGNCEHTINTLRYADRVKELKGPSNLGTEDVYMRTPPPPNNPVRKTSIPTYIKELTSFSPSKAPISPLVGDNRMNIETNLFDEFDNTDDTINSYLSSSPIKLTESDDSFILNSISNNNSNNNNNNNNNNSGKPKSTGKLREHLHHSIAVLYDRVSNCEDSDLLELLGEEMEGLLAAFNK
jgi:hypothetical protein